MNNTHLINKGSISWFCVVYKYTRLLVYWKYIIYNTLYRWYITLKNTVKNTKIVLALSFESILYTFHLNFFLCKKKESQWIIVCQYILRLLHYLIQSVYVLYLQSSYSTIHLQLHHICTSNQIRKVFLLTVWAKNKIKTFFRWDHSIIVLYVLQFLLEYKTKWTKKDYSITCFSIFSITYYQSTIPLHTYI